MGTLYSLYLTCWACRMMRSDIHCKSAARLIMYTKTLEAPGKAPSLAPRNSGRQGGGCTCLGITAASSPNRLHGGVGMRFVQGSMLVPPELYPYGGNTCVEKAGRGTLGKLWRKQKSMLRSKCVVGVNCNCQLDRSRAASSIAES